jgi:Kae1-associated kinase Bud32
MKGKIIAQGAEAILIRKGKVLVKDRIKKGYRHPEIDKQLRKRRTRSEARIISRASMIDVPIVKKVKETEIEMDFISGKRLSEHLDDLAFAKALGICKIIGKNVALLHEHDIVHGDLTTSNMILQGKKVFFIDFGLAFHSHRIEDKAVDLHLLRQAFESKHFLKYKSYDKSNQVLKQLEKVEMRGRYKKKQLRKIKRK